MEKLHSHFLAFLSVSFVHFKLVFMFMGRFRVGIDAFSKVSKIVYMELGGVFSFVFLLFGLEVLDKGKLRTITSKYPKYREALLKFYKKRNCRIASQCMDTKILPDLRL